jgi:hypothetical protein
LGWEVAVGERAPAPALALDTQTLTLTPTHTDGAAASSWLSGPPARPRTS